MKLAVAWTHFQPHFGLAMVTNSITNLPPNAFADAGTSLLRVFGALGIVLAIFLGGVWVVRNWQRLSRARSGNSQLQILESKALGTRHVLHVISYGTQRMLLSVSPTGVTLVSHLPSIAEEPATARAEGSLGPNFVQTLQQMVQRDVAP